MLNRRFSLSGLFAVLLALIAQLGAGASVPRVDPVAVGGTLCHTEDDADGVPSKPPPHSADCLVCPLCIALHVQSAALPSVVATVMPQDVGVILKNELPPPSTAPPNPHRPPSQPRAPPNFS